MAELVMQNWILLVAALLIGIAVAWWILTASSRKRVTIERDEAAADAAPARRNQALMDAPSAVSARDAASGEQAAPAAPIAPTPATPTAPVAAEVNTIPEPAPVPEPVPTAPAPAPAPAPVAGGSDDLTRIKGLGPKLAEQLRGMGITSFAQIAGWNDAEVDRVDEQLGRFRGRIRRDDWQAQAQLLAADDIAGYESRFGKL